MIIIVPFQSEKPEDAVERELRSCFALPAWFVLVSRNGPLDLRDFVLWQIAAAVFAIFPGVEVVVGTVGSPADDGEGAVLHALDLKDLFDEGLRSERSIHG